MAVWPSIAEPIFPIREVTLFPAYSTEKEGPYVQQRRKWSKAKKVFSLEWDEKCALTETDYQLLETFFLNNQGLAFTWTHVATGTSYTVMFNQDELDSQIVFPGYRSLSVQIREV